MALRDDVLRFYPQLAWALDIPDVARVLEQAVSNKWDSSRIQAELSGTGWWKGTVPSARTYEEKLRTDPTSIDESLRQLDARLWDQSQTLGLNLPGNVVDSIARQAIQFGWNEQQMNDALMMQGKNQNGNVGQIGTTQAQLKTIAANYFVGLDDQTAYNWAFQVAAGEKKMEDFTPILQGWSKSRFAYAPDVQNAIDSGVTVKDFFSPLQQEISKLLEVAPDSINLADNPTWARVLDRTDDQGNRGMMTIPEVQTYVRGMDQWKRTKQGQQSAADMFDFIGKTFGKVA